jgi:hypothetical protein
MPFVQDDDIVQEFPPNGEGRKNVIRFRPELETVSSSLDRCYQL